MCIYKYTNISAMLADRSFHDVFSHQSAIVLKGETISAKACPAQLRETDLLSKYDYPFLSKTNTDFVNIWIIYLIL